MAGEEDRESKTEEATEKKTRDAIERGNVPYSREASISVSLFGILIAFAYVLGERTLQLSSTLARFLGQAHEWRIENIADAGQILGPTTLAGSLVVAPVVVILVVAGIFASVAQNPPQLAIERIKPKFSRISPMENWQRIFGRQGAIEFLKALFKLAIVGAVAIVFLRSTQADLVNALFLDPTQLPEHVRALTVRAVTTVAIATVALVAGDVVWTRLNWRQELRMTRQEVKDEHKQLDGDPLIKARQRSVARARTRQRMLSGVKRATFVITNPTHYAIAMRYVREENAAPVVVAKGLDLLALRIREIANENDIPIIEDKPLARALYDKVQVDQAIPVEFYKAVASVVYYIMSRKAGSQRAASRA